VRKARALAIREKLRENAAHHLQPGETSQSVFCAQTTSQYFASISYWIILLSNAYRVVVVTDRGGLWWRCETLGEGLYIHKRFHKDVNAADGVPAA
jgi:hypothetical protein